MKRRGLIWSLSGKAEIAAVDVEARGEGRGASKARTAPGTFRGILNDTPLIRRGGIRGLVPMPQERFVRYVI